jgi:hypothetical protein
MRRFFQFGIYLVAAISLFWPMVMVAMNTAFAGADGDSPLYVALFTTHMIAIVLIAIGAAALLKKPSLPKVLIASGPFLACALLIVLSLVLFKEAAQRWIFIASPLALCLGALITGLIASPPQGETSWPQ